MGDAARDTECAVGRKGRRRRSDDAPDVAAERMVRSKPDAAAERIVRSEPDVAAERIVRSHPDAAAERIVRDHPDAAADGLRREGAFDAADAADDAGAGADAVGAPAPDLAARRARFVEVCDRMAPAMRRAALRVLRDAHEADDTVQDACLAAWRSLPALRETAALEGWILRITRNRAVSRVRTRRRQGRPEDRVHDDDLDAADGLPRVASRRGSSEAPPESVAAFRDAFDALPRAVREALRLRYERGLSLRAIADEQRTSLGGVKTRLYRGRERLRAAIVP